MFGRVFTIDERLVNKGLANQNILTDTALKKFQIIADETMKKPLFIHSSILICQLDIMHGYQSSDSVGLVTSAGTISSDASFREKKTKTMFIPLSLTSAQRVCERRKTDQNAILNNRKKKKKG